jgi:hypothetical protein
MTDDPLVLVAAVVVGIVGVARLVRLAVDDDFPPVVWLRVRYITWAKGGWETLPTCAFCMAPWITLVALAWAVASDLHWTWWAFFGWLAASYASSMIVVRDTPE